LCALAEAQRPSQPLGTIQAEVMNPFCAHPGSQIANSAAADDGDKQIAETRQPREDVPGARRKPDIRRASPKVGERPIEVQKQGTMLRRSQARNDLRPGLKYRTRETSFLREAPRGRDSSSRGDHSARDHVIF